MWLCVMTVPPALRSASPSSLRKQGSHRTRQRQGKGRAPARKFAPEDISGFRGGRVSKKRLEDGFGVFLSRGQRPGAALIATPSAKGRFFPAGKGANSGRSCIEHTVNADPATPPDAKTALQQGGFMGSAPKCRNCRPSRNRRNCRPPGRQSTVTPPVEAASSFSMQNVSPFTSKRASASVGSSRASARRGPRQPPEAR